MKFLFLLLLSFSAFGAPVKLNFTQTMGKSGNVLFAVFDKSSEFPKGTPLKMGSIATAGAQDVSVTLDLPPGEYAVSVFLDENNNRKLDQNMIGIPKERFGFSNNPRIRVGPPSYSDCAVRVLDQDNNYEIRLIKIL